MGDKFRDGSGRVVAGAHTQDHGFMCIDCALEIEDEEDEPFLDKEDNLVVADNMVEGEICSHCHGIWQWVDGFYGLGWHRPTAIEAMKEAVDGV